MSNVIEVSDLVFAYDHRRTILKGVSLTIRPGQVVAIMGGSGSGKTTLLRNLSGQESPTGGQVTVLGQPMKDVSQRDLYAMRRHIGMLFQFGGLFTDLSVFDNVAFPLRENTSLPESVIADLVLLKLEAVGLRGAARLFPSGLSGGMARRVALARAIALDPQLILYDEPFAGLDPVSLAVTANLIRRLNEALGSTSIIVTHDVDESFAIVDYVYMMWQGEIVAEGPPADMRASQLPFVQQFVGGKPDGPLPFHHPAEPLDSQLLQKRDFFD